MGRVGTSRWQRTRHHVADRWYTWAASRSLCDLGSDGESTMELAVVGAGVGRTGTQSLKVALEQLLDTPCHHMAEILGDTAQIPAWNQHDEGLDVTGDHTQLDPFDRRAHSR